MSQKLVSTRHPPGPDPPPRTRHPPPSRHPWDQKRTEFLTPACENITLPQTSFAGGKNMYNVSHTFHFWRGWEGRQLPGTVSNDEHAQGPKTLRRIRNQDYNHVIEVKVQSGYGPGGGEGEGGGENQSFFLKGNQLKIIKKCIGGRGEPKKKYFKPLRTNSVPSAYVILMLVSDSWWSFWTLSVLDGSHTHPPL